MRIDLHAHSNASDGELSPAELVAAAAARNIRVLGMTDHDSLDGLPDALRAAQAAGVVLVPGVELSAGPVDGRDVHILGYFVEPGDTVLEERLARLRRGRLERAELIIAALGRAGFGVTFDDVLEVAGQAAVGRAHIARALVNAGHADDIADAFGRYLGHGRPFYRPKPPTDPCDAVRMLLAAGALPVLAHPGVSEADVLLPALIDAGLAGIEAYHADHAPVERERYARMARSAGLLVTGGSDWHGPDSPNAELGSVELPSYVWPELVARAPAWFGKESFRR